MVLRPACELPLRGTYDVVVGGSGSAGLCAAISAARCGARVAIVDWLPAVGGTAASGLPLLNTNDGHGKQLTKGICEEMLQRLRQESAFTGDLARGGYFCYDVDKFRLIACRMLQEAGVEILTFTAITGVVMAGDRITHLAIQQKEGAGALAASAVVDCTGDADICHYAGEPMQGHEIDGLPQPPTLLFFVANVDEARMPPWHEIQRRHDELRPAAAWRNPRSGPAQSPPFRFPGKPGYLGFNVTRTLGIDAVATPDLVRMEIDQREQVDEYVHRFLRPHIPGFEQAFLSNCAVVSGIRETRRIRGRFVFTAAMIEECTEFPDAIAWSNYPVDRHSPRRGSTVLEGRVLEAAASSASASAAAAAQPRPAPSRPRRSYYAIPLRILVPARTANLLVAGRCMSADEMAFSALRVMGATMPMGEAAGIAAAIMARTGLAGSAVDPQQVRQVLAGRGALIAEE